MAQIGIRCALNTSCLWFYTEVSFMRAGGLLDDSPITRGNLYKEIGRLPAHPAKKIVRQLFNYEEVYQLTPRPEYFALDLSPEIGSFNPEEAWRNFLPKVIAILRRETRNPDGRVVVRPMGDPTVPDWHESLIRELFGE